MDFSDIRAVLECCEVRSLSKAARSMYVTPQGLGKMLDRVEAELNIPLFTRTSKGIEPTEAGLFFYEKGQQLIQEMRELEQGIEAIRTRSKKLRIGYACGLLRILDITKMEQFQNRMEPMDITWEESSNREIKARLQEQLLDIGIFIGSTGASELCETELCSRRMCAIVPETHPLYAAESVCLRDLADQQIITINEKYQSYTNFLNSCELAGFHPNIRIKTMESAMIYRFVKEGLGIGIDADIHDRKELPDGLKLIPIEDFLPWTVYVAYGKGQETRPEIREFLSAFLG